MSKLPLMSILINNYNYGRFLREAIDSALNQTYSNVEVIVVDDGSTDDSREVMESYNSRVTVVYKANGGQASAFNAGFPHSHGDLFCFLDSDDYLFPHAVDEIVRLYTEDHPVKIQWQLNIVDKNSKKTNQLMPSELPPEGDLSKQIIKNGPFYDWRRTPPSSGNAYDRKFLENVLPMPERAFRNGADVYLTVLSPIYGQIKTAKAPLGCYRSHGANNYWNKILDDGRVRNYMARFEANCEALELHLKRMGIEVDREGWKRKNINYVWPERLLKAKEDIAKVIPRDNKYILVNGDEWGHVGEAVPERCALPFLELDGEYGGPPAEDSVAIREMERLRNTGANFIVFWYTAFWWLDHYAQFEHYLKENFNRILKNDRLVIFDLRQPIKAILESR